MTPDDFSDDLLESMTPGGGRMPASRELRDVVLNQTTRTIRNRRRMRRVSVAATLVACYLGGVATMWLWSAASAVDRSQSGSVAGLAQRGEPEPGTVARKFVRPEDDQIADGSGAAAARLTPYERLRRTGDQQLETQDGMLAAVRTYKKALQLASSDQRGIDPDRDTWLLMAMKQSIN